MIYKQTNDMYTNNAFISNTLSNNLSSCIRYFHREESKQQVSAQHHRKSTYVLTNIFRTDIVIRTTKPILRVCHAFLARLRNTLLLVSHAMYVIIISIHSADEPAPLNA